MKSLLDALQEGRLIELPEADKEKSLQYLGTLIEAIPDFRSGLDFNGAVMRREKAANTGIGHGWACPHGRVSGEGELFCAIGWSFTGLDYSTDSAPVRILVMHYIPDSQKNVYLREIFRTRKGHPDEPRPRRALRRPRPGGGASQAHRPPDRRGGKRALPDVKARMIQLEAKQAVSALAETLPSDVLSTLDLIALSILIVPGGRPVVLAQDKDIIGQVESAQDLVAQLASRVPFDRAGYRIITRSVSSFQPDRLLYDCIAVKLSAQKK